MSKKALDKHPSEIFGCPYCDTSSDLRENIKQQYCPFIRATCVKPRKSEPHIKVGICSLWYKGKSSDEVKPVIICPQRFKEDAMFNAIRKQYLSHWDNIEWIPEVNIGIGGSVDYVAITTNKAGEIIDFFCVELQAAGTTGSPYQAIRDIMQTGKMASNTYNFGINWANEYSKTMMQQAYKKGKILNHWKRKIVFVIQDVGMSYLNSSTDTSKIVTSNKDMPVDFCTFKMEMDTSQKKWVLKFDKIYSTDIDGINLMLGGAKVDMYLTEQDFTQNIIRKGIAEKILKKELYAKYLSDTGA